MKKLFLAAAVSVAFGVPQAFAQANNFAGFSVAANANFITSNLELGASEIGSVKVGDSSDQVSLQGAYGFPVSDKLVVGVGATYTLGDAKLASLNLGEMSANIEGKDLYSIYLEPGYAVSPTTLVYAKLAYLSMKGELSVSGDGVLGSRNFKGTGIGFGVRTFLSKNVFLQAEFTKASYDNEVAFEAVGFKPTATTGTVGIGYQF